MRPKKIKFYWMIVNNNIKNSILNFRKFDFSLDFYEASFSEDCIAVILWLDKY